MVELLVVISIISILTIVGISSFKTVQIKSRDARRKNDMNSISKALNMYYNDMGNFPFGNPDINEMMTSSEGIGFSAETNGTIVTYMVEMPRETTNGVEEYNYISTTGKAFKLFSNLENENDNSCLKDDNGVVLKNFDSYTVTNGCIFGVSSSNVKIGDTLP